MSDKKVSIVVDTACDMLPEEAEKFGIVLIPLTVRFGNEEFYDGYTLSREEFYNRLIESDEIPKTSQITPSRYEECFAGEIEKGNDVVCLTLSSNLSGSYQSAMLAAQEFEGKVFVVDTLQVCGTQYLLAQRAVQMRDEGMSASDIAEAIEKEKDEPKIVALFDTLEYLKLGGRISSAAATLGNILSIKPVISIVNGLVEVIGKARGSKTCNNHLISFIQEHGGIDWSKPVLLSWTGNSSDLLEKYIRDSAALYEGRNPEDLPRSHVGSTIGTYTGPGCIAFSFYPNK